jgi:hypothetical protein
MRLKSLIWALPLGGMLLCGCGSGSALVGGVEPVTDAVALQAVSTRPSISLSRPTLSRKSLPSEGGPVVVGALVKLKNLADSQITVAATALDSKKRVVATQSMVLGEGGVWKTDGTGLVLQPNPTRKAVAFSINVIATTIAQPTIKKTLKAGGVTVAKSTVNPDQPPPPPSF